MSGFVSSITLSGSVFAPKHDTVMVGDYVEYVDNGQVVSFEQEAAGKVGRIVAVVAAVIVPFAAPAVFGAIAGSGFLGSTIAGMAAAGTMPVWANVLGSAVVGGIMQAGAAYLGGARGGDVWRAAGMGAIGGGVGGYFNSGAIGAGARWAGGLTGAAPGAPAAATTAVTSGGVPNAVGGTGPVGLTPSTVGANPGVYGMTGAEAAAAAQAVTPSGVLQNGIRAIFGNVDSRMMQQIGAVLIAAASSGQDMGRLNALVAQQQAELKALAAEDTAAYQQRLEQAYKIVAAADRMDPQWNAMRAMADAAGIEANEFRQAMRNIAVRQGGSLDQGQRNAYERGKMLHTARTKALAYNRGQKEAEIAQNQLRAQGAALFGPNEGKYRAMKDWQELDQAKWRAERDRNSMVAGGWAGILNDRNHDPSVSPVPSGIEEEEGDAFTSGQANPFGRNPGDPTSPWTFGGGGG